MKDHPDMLNLVQKHDLVEALISVWADDGKGLPGIRVKIAEDEAMTPQVRNHNLSNVNRRV